MCVAFCFVFVNILAKLIYLTKLFQDLLGKKQWLMFICAHLAAIEKM